MEIYEFKSLSRVVSTGKLAPNWLHRSEQPIRSQVSKLTERLTWLQLKSFHFRLRNLLLPPTPGMLTFAQKRIIFRLIVRISEQLFLCLSYFDFTPAKSFHPCSDPRQTPRASWPPRGPPGSQNYIHAIFWDKNVYNSHFVIIMTIGQNWMFL